MKRTFTLLVLILGMCRLSAQDTIPFMDPCFVYPSTIDSMFTESIYGIAAGSSFDSSKFILTTHQNNLTNYSYGEMSYWARSENKKLFIDPTHPRIYGVATTLVNNQLPPQYSFHLAAHSGGTSITQPIDSATTIGPYYQKNMYFSYHYGHGESTAVPCQIFLFPDPVTPTDTFYLGISGPDPQTQLSLWNDRNSDFDYYFLGQNFHDTTDFSVLICCEIYGSDMLGTFCWGVTHCWGAPFLIRELPCPRMWRPSTTSRSGGRTTLEWQAGDTALYLLAFFDDNDSLIFMSDTLTSNSFVLTDSMLLAAGYHGNRFIKARVSKACNYMDSPYHTLVWSRPSEPQRFYQLQASQGIGDVALPALSVSPNPAAHSLVVEGEEGVLQLLDLDGREVLTRRLRGRATLDVSKLPRGVYLLRLTTPEGSATQKVILM